MIATEVTYHSLSLSLPYLQECDPLDKNKATISKNKYRIATCQKHKFISTTYISKDSLMVCSGLKTQKASLDYCH